MNKVTAVAVATAAAAVTPAPAGREMNFVVETYTLLRIICLYHNGGAPEKIIYELTASLQVLSTFFSFLGGGTRMYATVATATLNSV